MAQSATTKTLARKLTFVRQALAPVAMLSYVCPWTNAIPAARATRSREVVPNPLCLMAPLAPAGGFAWLGRVSEGIDG